MIIAKFPSTRSRCRQPVAVGEWIQGAVSLEHHPARHVACAQTGNGGVATAPGTKPGGVATAPGTKPGGVATAPGTRPGRQRRALGYRYGWDGVYGSPSYYSSGQYDEES